MSEVAGSLKGSGGLFHFGDADMLDIETGYEGKFDFAVRVDRPSLTYMLATIPRSGSSWFGHMLWQTGCLGAPLEYINFDAGHYSFARGAPAQQDQLWRSVQRRRTSPNGVFGFKCFTMQLDTLRDGNPALFQAVMSAVFSSDPPKIVYLERRDRVAHAISYARATIRGVWRKEQEGAGAPTAEYSQAAMENAERGIEIQSVAWENMFRNMRIEPLRLWYEDAVARPDEAAGRVAAYLGVTIDPAAVVNIPGVERQAQGEAQAWVAQYAKERGAG